MVPSTPERPPRPPATPSPGPDDRHRVILRCLERLSPPVDLTELATWVFVSDRPRSDQTRFEPGLGREKARLHRVDLPQLEKRDALSYDRDRRVITSFEDPGRPSGFQH